MLHVLVRRLGWTLPVLLLVTAIMFLLMHAVPGSPWDRQGAGRALANRQSNTIGRATLDRRYGLDLPLAQQFVRYIAGYTAADGTFRCGAICGNLGPSYRQFGRTIEEILFQPPEGRSFWESRVGYSLRLGLYAFALALGLGLPLGIIAAVRQNGPLDIIIRVLTAVGVAIPNFVLGLLLIIFLGSGLGFITLVPGSWATAPPRTWIVPIVVLGFGALTSIARLTRASLLETLRQDYVRTARAKGLREQSVITVHVLKNALIPVITMVAPIVAELITGTFVIEAMFGFPGIGREYVQAVTEHDYSMVMGATLLYAVFIVFANLSVDIAYALVDPRATAE